MSRAGDKDKLERFAQALAGGKTPVEAAKIAGYPKGSSFAANARKRSHRDDVKARIAELQKPHLEKVNQAIGVNVEWATQQLYPIAAAEIDGEDIKASDKTRAIELMAKMNGWMAPEKREVNANIRAIERYIVDPAHPDSEGVSAAGDAGAL